MESLAECQPTLRQSSFQAMTDHYTDRCVLCGQAGHNSSQCPGETWPRWLGRWLALFALSMTFGAVLYSMGIR